MNVITITKVESDKFVKYHVTNLLSFVKFLDTKFPNWRYINVFNKDTQKQITSFTCKRRPTQRTIKTA